MPRVTIPGVGVVHFPYDMAPEQVQAEADKLYRQSQPKAEQPVIGDDVFGSPVGFSEAEQSAARVGGLTEAVKGVTSLAPAAGGAIGGLRAGIPGAAVGGAAGKVVQHLGAGESPLNADVLTEGLAQGASQAIGTGIAKAASGIGKSLYRGALKPGAVEEAFPNVVDDTMATGLRVGSRKSADAAKLQMTAEKQALMRDIDTAQAAAPTTKVKLSSLTKKVDRGDLNKASAADIEATLQQVAEDYPSAMSLRDLQTFKEQLQAASRKGTFRAAENRTLTDAGKKATLQLGGIARETLEGAVPSAAGRNAKIQSLRGATKALTQAANRNTGGAAGGLTEGPVAAAYRTVVSPQLVSGAGLLMRSAGRAPNIPANVLRAALLAAMSDAEPE